MAELLNSTSLTRKRHPHFALIRCTACTTSPELSAGLPSLQPASILKVLSFLGQMHLPACPRRILATVIPAASTPQRTSRTYATVMYTCFFCIALFPTSSPILSLPETGEKIQSVVITFRMTATLCTTPPSALGRTSSGTYVLRSTQPALFPSALRSHRYVHIRFAYLSTCMSTQPSCVYSCWRRITPRPTMVSTDLNAYCPKSTSSTACVNASFR